MNQNDPPTEHILACLSSSPSNAKIVRTAATMAKAFGGSFTALYVKTPDADWMSAQDKQRLQQHIHMAEQAGADITTLYGDDIPQQIAEFARLRQKLGEHASAIETVRGVGYRLAEPSAGDGAEGDDTAATASEE